MQRQQKNNADQYSKRVVELIGSVQDVSSLAPLEEIWNELLTILAQAVHDLDADKLSEESFNPSGSFCKLAWKPPGNAAVY